MKTVVTIAVAVVISASPVGCAKRATSSADGGQPDGAISLPDGGGSPDAGGPSSPLGRYCEAASDFMARCSESVSSGCDRARLSACEGTYAVEREEFLVARAECGFPEACDDPETYDERICVFRATEDLMPTDDQTALAETLCTNCERDDDCLDQFWFRGEPQDDGSVIVSGIGTSFLHLSGALVSAIAADCVPPPGADRCLPVFYDCVTQKTEDAQPASVVSECGADEAIPGT